MRGVTIDNGQTAEEFIISTHTPHARRDRMLTDVSDLIAISTHTPHARRDLHM